MQAASTDDLIFSVPALVAHLSRLMTLEPGDIVSTGTPAGVGSTREPRVWLKPGDEIVISSPTLGRLETRIGVSALAALRHEQGREHQRQEPDDVEVEPVRRADLDGDQHRRRQRGDLGRRLSRGPKRNREREATAARPARSAAGSRATAPGPRR